MAKFLKCYGECQGPLDFPMKESDARELEKKLETGEYSPFRIQKSDFEYFIEGEKADVSIISDPSVDKDGEVVDPESLDFAKYRSNPLVPYNHNYEIPPLGKSIWQKQVGKVWKAKTVYTPRPNDYPKDDAWFADTVFHMIKSGTMRGKSIGGAVAWREPTQADADRLGFSLEKCKRITKAVEIWEYSVCPLGVNSNTVVELVSKGLQVPDILLSEFPEVQKYLQAHEHDNELDIPEIKSFTTAEDFIKKFESSKRQKLSELEAKIPNIVELQLKRILGKVC